MIISAQMTVRAGEWRSSVNAALSPGGHVGDAPRKPSEARSQEAKVMGVSLP